MIRFCFFILLFLGSCWILNPSYANDTKGDSKEEITACLKESLNATRTLPFAGEMVFHRQSAKHDWNTITKVIRFPNGEKEMIITAPELMAGLVFLNDMEGFWATPPNKERQEKIQNNEDVDHDLIERVFWKRNVLNLLDLENFDLVLKNYKFISTAEENIAGRDAKKIAIQCKYSCRPSFLIWLDKETTMQLKYQRLAPSGEFMEEFYFKSIDLKPDFEKQEKVSRDSLQKIFSYDDDQQKKLEPDFTPLETCFLPEGFSKKEENCWNTGQGRLLHLLYTDGLAYISIFQRKQTEKEKEEQTEKKICPQDIRRIERREKFIFYREANGMRISIVGDVSPDELIKTLSGFKPGKK